MQPSAESNDTIGYILSLEGADSFITLDYVEIAYNYGLRAIGPAHYGPGTYAFGTDSVGSIGNKGKSLLSEMQRLGIILDATHLCDESFFEAMDHFSGSIWASHNNPRGLVNHNRQFSDEQLKELFSRNSVIGVPLDDIRTVGQLLGEKTILNEFFAYASLSQMKIAGALTYERSIIIATYALCGFANFASIGIQIGGIGVLAPSQRANLAKFGIKALIGGTVAALLTATIAGMIIG